MRRLLPALLLLAACSGEPALGTSSTTGPAAPTTIAPTTTGTPTTVPEQPDDVLLSIPVGDGIEYSDQGEDLPPIGPSLITADRDGGLHFYDPVANRILSFGPGGEQSIDLGERDILGVSALAAASDHLLLVEISYAPVRERVHRVGYDGTVLETIELPVGYSLEDGLSGVRAGDDDQIITEYGGGAYWGVWLAEAAAFQTSPALSIAGSLVITVSPDLSIDAFTIEADLSGDLGGIRYLGTTPDGVHAVVREEVRITSSVFDVLTTVEWYSPTGEFLGSARVPSLREQEIDAPPGITLMPDGRAIALVATADAVEAIELPRVTVRITDLMGSSA